MAKQLQLRKGTATEHNTFTGANGEVTVDTTNKTLRVHDGTTAGGTQLATLTGGLVPAAQLPAATTSVKGAVVLNNTLTSTSTTEALTAAQGKVLNDQAFGVGQTWQDVTASRANGVTYINTTGKPIQLSIVVKDTNNTASVTLKIGGVVAAHLPDLAGGWYYGYQQLTAIVPTAQSYQLDTSEIVSYWAELR